MTTVAVTADVRTLPDVLVPLGDGVSLAATLYLPGGAGASPTLVSFNPYRKDDIAGAFSHPWCSYFARRGYAHLVVDTRGTGSSAGVANETFHPREAQDGAEVVEWAAAQAWCDGSVGVWGMSYGGAMALAVAARRPAALRAIASVYGYSDYYLDSAYPGGCPNCLGKFARESWMLALELAPPSYVDPEGRWLAVWRERLDRLDRDGPSSMRWRDHADRDAYWQARAVDIEAIDVPTFLIGGWRDLFPEATVRTYERLVPPKRLLIGPWLHASPDVASVEPVDWLGELGRWWDRWLRGADDAVEAEPPVTLFVQGAGWRHEHDWPSARASVETRFLAAGGRLAARAGENGSVDYDADPRVGVAAGLWDPLGIGVGYPLDQGADDLASLTYTGEPLDDDVEITGSPVAVAYVSLLEGRDVNLVAKLVDVASDGPARLITTGWLRGAHRDGHGEPRPLEPGCTHRLTLQLWATSYLVPRGHRIRLSVACADFPRVWPTRDNPCIRIHHGASTPSHVSIPTVPADGASPVEPPRPPANGEDPAPWDVDGGADWRIAESVTGETRSVLLGGRQKLRLPQGGRFAVEHAAEAIVGRERPDGARIDARSSIEMELASGERVEIRTRSLFFRDRMACSAEVAMDGSPFYGRTWRNF